MKRTDSESDLSERIRNSKIKNVFYHIRDGEVKDITVIYHGNEILWKKN